MLADFNSDWPFTRNSKDGSIILLFFDRVKAPGRAKRLVCKHLGGSGGEPWRTKMETVLSAYYKDVVNII